jgi:hypothetical protein
LICERAEEPGDIVRGKEDLVRYMAWRSPDTLQAYEHYFDDRRHAETQDQLYTSWYEEDLCYEQMCVEASPETIPAPSSSSVLVEEQDTEVIKNENGWDALLMLGGPAHA